MSRQFQILFVDNDIDAIQSRLADYLQDPPPPWTCRFARTLQEAENHLSACEPDAVVLDLNLEPSRRGGIELLRMLRRAHGWVPVVGISDGDDARLLVDAYENEVITEELEEREIDPDAVVLRSDILSRAQSLREVIEYALWEAGRVANDDAVLITHGTDTMAWAFAYLRYALKGLRMNVAITGSQIPLEGYFSISDALGNLKTAVYLLNRLRPAHLFCVFREGKSTFTRALQKVRKWDNDAFDGELAALEGVDHPELIDEGWRYVHYPDQKLKRLHLVRTGGTIESRADDFGALKPTGDFVLPYLQTNLSSQFRNIVRNDLFQLDSSNMALEQWSHLATYIAEIGAAESVDLKFASGVDAVVVNPFSTEDSYRNQFRAAERGILLLGYGAGNGNTDLESGRSVIPAIREAIDAGKYVVASSQVSLECYDVDYDTGRALLVAGAIPAGDLSAPEAQMRLSYLLGHLDEIETVATRRELTTRQLLTAAFLSGVTFRKRSNLVWYEQVLRARGMPIRVLGEDPFVLHPFEPGLEMVAECIDGRC